MFRPLDLVSAIGDHGRMSQRRRVLAVIGPGSGETRTDPIPEATRALAYDIGRRAIDAGFRLATGGLGGVMAAAAGAASARATHAEAVGASAPQRTFYGARAFNQPLNWEVSRMRDMACAH